ncbi:DUF6445 family protein [Cytobacillus horneckiae]|uniref:DUF6445 family protein n=1 Tax=Cytobacillus horneckiae TaxID=549687 RepID=UPI0039A12EA0
MDKRIIVVDNFYSNPDAIRSFAFKSGFSSGAKYNYPGYQSEKRFVNIDAIQGAFEKLIGKKIDLDLDRFTFGGFRIITSETGAKTKVHADSVIDWAGLVFLTPNAPMSSGFGVLRHKETNRISPPTDKEAREMGFEDAQEFEREIVHRDMADLSKWELVNFIGPVYNRLVLFRGNELYHAPLGGVGAKPEEARLTHNFFFNEKVLV